MCHMEIEAVGALAAAIVALIGIPSTMLVGRWQMKAALRSAEATYEAGLVQADSTYRAALDAVRADANAAHTQWRHGIQREAYASFLLASHRLVEVGRRFAEENDESMSEERIKENKAESSAARAALESARIIIELEGPDDVAAPAAVITEAAQSLEFTYYNQAAYNRANGKKSQALASDLPHVRDAASALSTALVELSRISLNFSGGGELNEQEKQARDAAIRSCMQTRSALSEVLDDEEFYALVYGYKPRPPTRSEAYSRGKQEFLEAEAEFIRAVRVELHS